MAAIVVTSDTAGGVILSSPQTFVTINGLAVTVVGSPILTHTPFIPPHTAATMATGSVFVTINGLAVCKTGDLATCLHSAIGTNTWVDIEI